MTKLEFEFRFSDFICISINFNRLLQRVYHMLGTVLQAGGANIGDAVTGLRVTVSRGLGMWRND